MANSNSKLMHKQAEDETLSALLDGELSPEQEEDLRRRMAEDPQLAERCAEFAEIGGALQRLATAAPDPKRLRRIQQGLRSRIDADELAETLDPPSAQVIPFPLYRRAAVGVVAALAAALALYLAIDPGSELETPASPKAPRLAEAPVSVPKAPAPVAVIETPRLAASAVSPEADAVTAEAVPSETLYPADTPEDLRLVEAMNPVHSVAEEDAPLILPDADEQLAIALEYGMLADFDVILNLELLESLYELETVESM